MLIFANVIQSAFSPLISAFEWVLVFIHDHILGGASWGLAIVGLTIVVRAVMVPLTLKQFRSMRKMQVLAPQLKELQQKYKDDKQRQSEEMMKFYRENGVNPFASCLPLLLQLPVLISLFYMLRTDLKLDICKPEMLAYFREKVGNAHLSVAQIQEEKLTHAGKSIKQLGEVGCSQVPGGHHLAGFLFIPDITLKASGTVLIVLIGLYIASQLGSSLMMMTSAEPAQRWLMLGLPLVFVFFFIRYPAGLLVYWITTNVWTIGQQYLVRRQHVDVTPAGGGGGSSGSDGSGGGSGGSPNGGPASSRGGRRSIREREPALLTSTNAASTGPPPPPPRKKKKRSGRRR